MISWFEKLKRKLNWENWPFDLLYFPIGIFWLWYALKAKHFWYFTPVNPSLDFAGFEGGSKREMYELLPEWSYPVTLYINPGDSLTRVKKEMQGAKLNFPVVVKPDTGRAGILFRVINTENELYHYHERVGETYLLQEYVNEGNEYTVFHIRYPGAEKGFITGLVVKDFLHVTGDGILTLHQLMQLHPVAKFKASLLEKRHAANLQLILKAGEKYFLNPSGNHNVGTKFVNLNHEIDDALCQVFDGISRESGQFYFGRYDLRCPSLEDLKAGRNICIFEYNGAGAALVHLYDRNMSYWAALSEIVQHWRHLYKIGKLNNQNGVPYLGFKQGLKKIKAAKQNFKRMQAVDKWV